MEFIEIAKEHPIPIGIGVLVVLLLMRSGSTSAPATDNGAAASLQSQQIATSGNVSIAGINAGVQTAAMSAATSRAAISADMWKTGVTTSAGLAMNDTAAQMQALISSMGFMSSINDSNNKTESDMLQSTLGAQVANKQLNTQLAISTSNNNLTSSANVMSYDLARQKQNDTTALATTHESNVFANLSDVLANNQALATINSNTQQQIASGQNNAMLMALLLKGGSSTGNAVAGAASGIGSLLSGAGTGIGSIFKGLSGLLGGTSGGTSGAASTVLDTTGGSGLFNTAINTGTGVDAGSLLQWV